MSSGDLLVAKMLAYRDILKAMQPAHPEIGSVLAQLRELFTDIENGLVEPPCEGRYRSPFHSEYQEFYVVGNPLSEAEAAFVSALEDWPSKSWYQAIVRSLRSKAGEAKTPNSTQDEPGGKAE